MFDVVHVHDETLACLLSLVIPRMSACSCRPATLPPWHSRWVRLTTSRRGCSHGAGSVAPDDDLILLTDRGMYADHRGDHLVDEILVKLGLAAQRGQSTSAASGSWRNRLLAARAARQAYRSVAQKLPHRVREALLPFHRAMIGAPAPWDWTRTQIFRLPSVGNSYLRVNLAGREPAGIVTPGARYNALLAQIETQFRALVDPSTGESVVEDVYFPTDHFQGPKSNELPDVAIVWSSRRPINAAKSDALGTVSGQQIVERSGNHRPEGFALFRGPSFGASVRTGQGDARQIAPAILNVFGVQVPAHYDLAAPESIGTSPLPLSPAIPPTMMTLSSVRVAQASQCT
jgi:hypothetical protein